MLSTAASLSSAQLLLLEDAGDDDVHLLVDRTVWNDAAAERTGALDLYTRITASQTETMERGQYGDQHYGENWGANVPLKVNNMHVSPKLLLLSNYKRKHC